MLRSPPPILPSLATIGLRLPPSRCLIGSPSLSSSGSLPKVPRFRSPRLSRFGSLAGTKGAANIFKSRSLSILANQSSVLAPEVPAKTEEIPLLAAVKDDHGGVVVKLKNPMDSKVFLISLKASVATWRKQGIKGVWIKLPIEFANLVEAAVKEGFWFHHAEPNYLMLVCWLPDIKHTIPINASHRVGIGAFVMNDKREVLVVQEKNCRFRGSGLWKFPTGVIDQGEDIHTGAIREVKDETGIDTEFVEVIAFSQSHMSFFEKSDLSFICMLRPLSHDINPQESKIEAAKWLPMVEYAAQPFVQKHELVKYILNISLARMDNSYAGFSSVGVKSPFFDRAEYLYLNSRVLNHPSITGDASESGRVSLFIYSVCATNNLFVMRNDCSFLTWKSKVQVIQTTSLNYLNVKRLLSPNPTVALLRNNYGKLVSKFLLEQTLEGDDI